MMVGGTKSAPLWALAAVLLITVPVSAEGPGSAGFPMLNPTPSTGLLNSGLLDLSRFDISHSLSYGVSSSSTYGTASGGLWLTEIGYRVSDPLRISVDVGAAINTDGGPIMSENSFFLHSFNLDYRPSNSFVLNISYVNLPDNAPLSFARRPGWGSPLGLPR